MPRCPQWGRPPRPPIPSLTPTPPRRSPTPALAMVNYPLTICPLNPSASIRPAVAAASSRDRQSPDWHSSFNQTGNGATFPGVSSPPKTTFNITLDTRNPKTRNERYDRPTKSWLVCRSSVGRSASGRLLSASATPRLCVSLFMRQLSAAISNPGPIQAHLYSQYH